jgi:hypothetical protein
MGFFYRLVGQEKTMITFFCRQNSVRRLPILFSIIFLSSYPERVEADYEPPTAEMAFASASLVFEGEVLSNVPKEDTSIQGHPDWLTVATFRVNNVWKSGIKKGDVIKIYLVVDPCGITISPRPGNKLDMLSAQQGGPAEAPQAPR